MVERSRGGNSSMIYLIYRKNLCKCNNVPHPVQKQTNKKTEKKKNERKSLENPLILPY
jgi:hypothetical protein